MERHNEGRPESLVMPPTTSCIDWYSQGEERVVRIGNVEVRIRFVGRKGRRGRILIEAPAGAVIEGCSR